MAEYTPKLLKDTTWQLKDYTPSVIGNTTFELGAAQAKVNLLSPANNATGVTKEPTFSWDAFETVPTRRYQVKVTQVSGDYTSALQYVTANMSFTIPTADQLLGSTTYYWVVTPGFAQIQDSYSETFNIANQQGWPTPWFTQTLKESGTQEIVDNKGVLSINPTDVAISVARLDEVTADSFELIIENEIFTDVTTGLQPTYHFSTQGDWRNDNFITGYFFYRNGIEHSFGRMPEGGVNIISGSRVNFERTVGVGYDTVIRKDNFRLRAWVYPNGEARPTQPLIDVVDSQELFTSGGFAIKAAGSVASSMSIDSISARFSQATAGVTVTSFAIDQSDTTVSANGTRQLTTTTQGTNASGGATWASSNDAVATVDSNGLVTWVSAGMVTITATSTDDGLFTDTIQVTAQAVGDYVAQDSRAGDEAFMQAFYDSTNGGSWENNTGWVNGDMDLSRSNIAGVTVDTVGGELRIVNFDMAKEITDGTENFAVGGNNIIGTLPPEWGNLTKCKQFNVKQNFFTGEIPDTLQSGCLMERISLGGQKGELDMTWRSEWYEEDHRGRLYRENIGGGTGKRIESTNNFEDSLPISIANCPNIDLIEMRHQSLTGTLPVEWAAINPRGIFLNNSEASVGRLGGILPPEWGSMNNLVFFSIECGPGEASFSGTFPQEIIDGWTNIANVQVVGQNFEGSIPRFTNSRDKRHMAFEDNNFTGGFPDEWLNGDNRYISAIKIKGNPLGGSMPQTIPSPTFPDAASSYNYISTMRLDNCGLTGSIPIWAQEISSFIQFQLGGNNFTGGFPVIAAENPDMRLFWIGGNDLSGDLPDISWGTQQLYSVLINSNNFTGNIPTSWSTMKDSQRGVWRFYANNNELEGAIPTWLSEMPDLERLYIQDNRFTYKDIIPLYQTIKDNLNAAGAVGRGSVDQYIISPQKEFNVPNESVSGTAPVTVDLSSIDYTNNAYQWQRIDNGSWVDVSGQTTNTLSTSTSGDYRLRITNSNLPELSESISKTINVTVT